MHCALSILRCICSVMGISQRNVWDERLTRVDVLERWNPRQPRDIPSLLTSRRMEWLGHVVRMHEERAPRQLLFGTLHPVRPMCGPRKRWRDAARKDLAALGIDEWYDLAQDRREWRAACNVLPPPEPVCEPLRIPCAECGRLFSRSGLPRHKCLDERRKPVSEQRGSRQCSSCERWFRSAGGLAVHKCPK
eukprot:scpid74806/ scgid3707/ 